MPEVSLRITARSETDSRLVVRAGKHQVIVDEPESAGGTDTGPTPLQYLLASVVGCVFVVGQIVAEEMGIKLRGVEMTAKSSLNPDRLRGRPTKDRAGLKGVSIEVNVDSDADRQTLEKWLRTVESRCPVADNLLAPTPVEVHLA